MKVVEIREIAQLRGMKPGRTKKEELVRAIQTDEGNDACFNTGRVTTCGQQACLWREDCR